jgi:hypothetical protein
LKPTEQSGQVKKGKPNKAFIQTPKKQENDESS